MVRIVATIGNDAPLEPGSSGIRVRVDERRALPGRGAWLHAGCADAVVQRRAVPRALRIAGEAFSSVEKDLRSQLAAYSAEISFSGRREGSGLEADGHPMSTQR